MAWPGAVGYHGGMTSLLVHDKPMTLTDWLFDLVIAVGAFGFGCLQLTLAVNLLIPDEALRRLMGIDAMVPTAAAILAVAVTTLPLVLRRRCPWPTLLIVLVAYRLDIVIGSAYIRDAVIIAFLANETISIIENAGLMGIPIPPVIMRAIEVLKDKMESEGDQG